MKDNKETKEGILAGLEDKSRQEYLYNEFLEAEKKFIESLKDLKNFDEECDCEEVINTAHTISTGDAHYEEEYVIVERCLVCGGYIMVDV